MKPLSPNEVINGWFERVWKARDKNAIDAIMAEDAVAHLAGGAQVRGGTAQFSDFHACY
jgi:hypothetical protein